MEVEDVQEEDLCVDEEETQEEMVEEIPKISIHALIGVTNY